MLVAQAADIPDAFSIIKAISENNAAFDHAAFDRRLSAEREADERESRAHDTNDSPNPDRKQLTSLEGDPRFALLYQPLQWVSPADDMREGLADIRSGAQWALAPNEGGWLVQVINKQERRYVRMTCELSDGGVRVIDIQGAALD
ncbi:hypothetical protein C7S18_19850 [Ahniella affigens]|uniref:Uncharacterized protein n=1 Tax=Ahniella affigens TaxID=2021234 RepID=A0A2P1PWP6_9GAMM|nr:hypothetical protein [Ahniella affigens]AVP99281.1 hypothetical protein C7S18_19850 [Ahniella affigens]